MEIKHTQVALDINNRCDTKVVGIVNVNDKKTRYIDVALLASGTAIDLTGCTATAVFVIDDVLINNAVNCTIASNVVTIPLENFNARSGYLSIEINIKKGDTEIINTPIPVKVQVTSSIADFSQVDGKTYGTIADAIKEVDAARGEYNDLSARLNDMDKSVQEKANKSEVYTKDEVETLLDEYDANYVVDRLKDKADKTALEALSKTVTDNKTATDTALESKANKTSFEQGTGNLSCIDDVAKSVIKSASFNYVKNNNAVTITFNIVFNAGTIPQSGFVRFSGLPFKTQNVGQLFTLVADNKNKQYYCKLYGTWLSFTAVSGATVSADETISFSATYII